MAFLRALSICALAMGILAPQPGWAHEVRPAVADVAVGADAVDITLRLVLEPILAGMDLSQVQDTAASPLAQRHDALRLEPPAALEATLRAAWPELAARFRLVAGGNTLAAPELVSVTIPEVGDPELPRDSLLVLRAGLPPDGSALQLGWDAALGGLVVRQAEGGPGSYAAILTDGALSEPLPRGAEAADGGAGAVALRFLVSGFEHILPKGLDHILFVLGLFFFALKLRPLLWQVTSFTLAHTVTLALASLGIVAIPASIVEPLIAASIVYVAVENVFGRRAEVGWHRVALVFGFGLLHGLGFASVLSEVGLPEGRFVLALIAFNIGVELGQLAVIAGAALVLALPFGQKPWYRRAIAIPASLAIAAIGAWWTFERVFL